MFGTSFGFSSVRAIAFAGATLLAPHVARADDIASCAYNNLTGKYVAAGNHFTALSQNGDLSLAATNFTISRLMPVIGSSTLEFSLPHGVATFSLDMTLSNVTASSATAVGTLLIKDLDGDKITADIVDGAWANAGGFAFLGAALSNIQIVSSGNGWFDGTSDSGFSMAFPPPSPYSGVLITLIFQGWFTNSGGVRQDFDKKPTNGSAQMARNCGIDSDADGVGQSCDLCPNTVPGAPVDADGCPPLIPGDTNRDGDVDAADLTVLRGCRSGPRVPRPQTPACASFDFDGDQDVDQDDFGRFQRCYSGEDHPANPNCAG